MARWLERKPGWLGNKNSNENNSIDEPDEGGETYGVTFIPLRCPKCGSKKVRCYAHRLPVRYHYCKVCGHRFKSVEKD